MTRSPLITVCSTVGLVALAVGTGFGARTVPPLVEAAKSSNTAAIRALLRGGTDVNAPDVDGTTALHWAARVDNGEIAGVLIAAGARPNAANRYGVTPLALAAANASG